MLDFTLKDVEQNFVNAGLHQNDFAHLLFNATTDLAQLHSLLEHTKLSPDVTISNNLTPFVYCVLKQRFEAASILFNYGANPFQKDNSGRCVLHLSALFNLTTSLEYSLELGCPIDALDNFDMTPLHLAVLHDSINAAQGLISRGASLDLRDSFGMTPYLYAVENGVQSLIYVLPKCSYDLMASMESRTLVLSKVNALKKTVKKGSKGKERIKRKEKR
ncbi:hypothetical protein GEMRC1_014002 [Eukaryota sp. GEM-RC1]